MRTIILFSILFLCSAAALAQEKQSAQPNAADKPIPAKSDAKPLPESIALTPEETNTIRVYQLRAEKLSANIEKLQTQLKAEGERLQTDFTAILSKHGLTQEQARGYDVLNGESESDRPILLKKKAPPKPDAPKP